MLTEGQARKLLKLLEDYYSVSTESKPDNPARKLVLHAKKKLYDYIKELTEGNDAGPYLPPTA